MVLDGGGERPNDNGITMVHIIQSLLFFCFDKCFVVYDFMCFYARAP